MSRRFEEFEPLPFRRFAWPSYDVFPADLRSRTTDLSTDALALLLLLPAAAWELGEGWYVSIPDAAWLRYVPIDLDRSLAALKELAARDLAVWEERDGSVRVGFPFLYTQLADKKRGRPQKQSHGLNDRPVKNGNNGAVDSPVIRPVGRTQNGTHDRPVDDDEDQSDDRPPPSPALSPTPAPSSAPATAPAEDKTTVSPDGDTRPADAGPGARSGQVDVVIAHYRKLHARARPSEKERRLISSRLKDGFTVEDLIQAINGCHASPFHRGENDRNRPYQSLELIVRDAKHVQDFIEVLSTIEKPTPGIDADAVKVMTQRIGLDATLKAIRDDQNRSLSNGTP